MTPKRGAPVMVELMRRQSARAGGTAPEGTDPYASPNQPGLLPAGQEPSMEDPGEALNRHAVRGQQLQFWGILITAIVVLITLTAILAFRFGETTGRQDGAKFSDAGALGGSSSGQGVVPPVINPGDGQGGGGEAPAIPGEDPARGASSSTQLGGFENDIRSGWNYLVVATLRREDAELSARFLAENGIPVKLIAVGAGRIAGTGGESRGGVDRRGEARKDSLWQVVVLRGIPPTEFSARRAERDDLVQQIVGLGRTWRSRDRSAPTNFASPYWDRMD
jgi:hypothetical protein